MNGNDFKALRQYSRISRLEFAKLFGYKSDFIIRDIEKYDSVPIMFVKKLSELVFVDLTKPDNVKTALEGIPEKFFKTRKVNRRQEISIWRRGGKEANIFR